MCKKVECKLEDSVELAKDHVEWFLDLIKPLLISYFVHGHKHGVEEVKHD